MEMFDEQVQQQDMRISILQFMYRNFICVIDCEIFFRELYFMVYNFLNRWVKKQKKGKKTEIICSNMHTHMLVCECMKNSYV